MNRAEFKRERCIARLVIRALPYFLENNPDSVAKHTLLLNISPIVLPTIKSLDLRDYDKGFFTTNKRFLSVIWVDFRNNRFHEKYVSKLRFRKERAEFSAGKHPVTSGCGPLATSEEISELMREIIRVGGADLRGKPLLHLWQQQKQIAELKNEIGVLQAERDNQRSIIENIRAFDIKHTLAWNQCEVTTKRCYPCNHLQRDKP